MKRMHAPIQKMKKVKFLVNEQQRRPATQQRLQRQQHHQQCCYQLQQQRWPSLLNGFSAVIIISVIIASIHINGINGQGECIFFSLVLGNGKKMFPCEKVKLFSLHFCRFVWVHDAHIIYFSPQEWVHGIQMCAVCWLERKTIAIKPIGNVFNSFL